MSSTAVVALGDILIPGSMAIVVAPRVVPGFRLMKIDYILLINATSMFLNLVDQICGAR